ncbi:Transcriptional regulatory protein QseF [Burkholderiaceae bacterium]|nr:Transcriptional regulatory protein QseF [Burkholderiaceae bacterium]
MSALRKVLVVDDDPVVARSFDRVLSSKGYIVITAENGYDALQKLQAEKVDVVFTDIRMPGMDGLEVAERVKARQPWTPVVIVTGYGTTANEERAKAAGVTEFLHKPVSPEDIEESALRALMQPAPATEAAPAKEAAEAVAAPAAPAAPAGKLHMLKNMALFLSAPFVGLVYAVLLPFVGLGMLAYFAAQALAEQRWARTSLEFGKFLAKVVVAPFIGLAYFVVFPIVALAVLAWTGAKALVTRPQSE